MIHLCGEDPESFDKAQGRFVQRATTTVSDPYCNANLRLVTMSLKSYKMFATYIRSYNSREMSRMQQDSGMIVYKRASRVSGGGNRTEYSLLHSQWLRERGRSWGKDKASAYLDRLGS